MLGGDSDELAPGGGGGERGDIRACGQEQTLAPGYPASSPSFATYNLYKMELNS